MISEKARFTYQHLFLWVLYTTLPTTIGFGGSQFESSDRSPLLWFIPSLCLPFWTQWFILRKHFPWAYAWLVFSPLGFTVGIFVPPVIFLSIFNSSLFSEINSFWPPISIGICTGIMQYILLRRSVQPALLWIAASLLGWLGVFSILSMVPFLSPSIMGLGIGLVYGSITGVTLAYLVNHGHGIRGFRSQHIAKPVNEPQKIDN
jgi:hypothetical protein